MNAGTKAATPRPVTKAADHGVPTSASDEPHDTHDVVVDISTAEATPDEHVVTIPDGHIGNIMPDGLMMSAPEMACDTCELVSLGDVPGHAVSACVARFIADDETDDDGLYVTQHPFDNYCHTVLQAAITAHKHEFDAAVSDYNERVDDTGFDEHISTELTNVIHDPSDMEHNVFPIYGGIGRVTIEVSAPGGCDQCRGPLGTPAYAEWNVAYDDALWFCSVECHDVFTRFADGP